jgi:hypothetical protein
MKKLLALAVFIGIGVACFSSIAAAESNYICVKKLSNGKYVVHASSEQAYQNWTADPEPNIFYLITEKPLSVFAQAGVFGTYDTPQAARTAIQDGDAALQGQLVSGFKLIEGIETD